MLSCNDEASFLYETATSLNFEFKQQSKVVVMQLSQPPNWTHLFNQRCFFSFLHNPQALSNVPFVLN